MENQKRGRRHDGIILDIRLFLDLGEDLETILAFITQHPN